MNTFIAVALIICLTIIILFGSLLIVGAVMYRKKTHAANVWDEAIEKVQETDVIQIPENPYRKAGK